MSTQWSTAIMRIVSSLEAPDYDTRIAKTTPGRELTVMLFFAGILLADLYSIWWRGDSSFGWFFFWSALALYTFVVTVAHISESRQISAPNPSWDSDEALVLRETAIVGDDTIAPLAETQPEHRVVDQPSNGAIRMSGLYRPLAHLPKTNRIGYSSYANLLNIFVLGLISVDSLLDPRTRPFLWQIYLLFVVLLGVTLLTVVETVWERLPFDVVADTHGIRWQRDGKRRTILWSEAQALCMFELPQASSNSRSATGAIRRIYWLQGPGGAITWASKPSSRGWHKHETTGNGHPTNDEEAWNLCALAASRTGLPLRDVTEATKQLIQFFPRVALIFSILGSKPVAQRNEAERLRFMAQRANRRIRTRIVFGIEASLSILLLVAGLTLLIAVPHAYTEQLRQAQQSTPIFADSLARPSGQWPNGATAGITYSYMDGGYEIGTGANDSGDMFALAKPTFGNLVMQVSIHQISDFHLASSGIVVRADERTHQALVFDVSASGEWKLMRFQLGADASSRQEIQTLAEAGVILPVAAIHQGGDITNRLSVIRHGESYAFFINGQFVITYHDSQFSPSHVGLYTDGTGQTTTFSNFIIYPMPSSDSPLTA